MPQFTITLTPLEAAVVTDEVTKAQDGRDETQHLEILLKKVLAPRVERFKEQQSSRFAGATAKLDEITKVEFTNALALADPRARATALQVALDRYKARVQ